jgi:hypothetical protein
MLRQRLLGNVLMLLVWGGAIEAQTAPAARPQVPTKDPVDVKLQDALR